MKTQNITRSEFLNYQLPVFAYCEIGRGPSTQFNESFHIENRNTKIILNFWWDSDETVSVNTYNSKEQDPFKKNVSHSIF